MNPACTLAEPSLFRTIHVFHQVSLEAAGMLLRKAQFELDTASYHVTVKQYHVDNGIFTFAAWKDNLHGECQQQQVSGTIAHHQNAIAECVIQTITSMARALLIT
jgi:hypothetical protein